PPCPGRSVSRPCPVRLRWHSRHGVSGEDAAPEPLVPRAAGDLHRLRVALLLAADAGLLARADHHVHGVPGHRVLEPIAGLLFDIGRIVPPRQLLPELGELPLVRAALLRSLLEGAARGKVTV